MRSVEKGRLFLTQLVTHRGHGPGPRVRNGVVDDYELYQVIRERYATMEFSGERTAEKENLPSHVFFQREPITYAQELYARISEPLFPAYLNCCYDSYPLTNRINAGLYIQKILNLQKTTLFSIADAGALAPFVALEWANTIKENVLVCCMEQWYDRLDMAEKRRYMRGEAFAMFHLTEQPGPLQVLAFDQREVPACQADLPQDTWLADCVHDVACLMLEEQGVSPSEVLVLAHSFSDLFIEAMRARFPHVFVRGDRINLSTADPFYSLEDVLEQAPACPHKYLLLTVVDGRNRVGCLLLHSERN